LGTLGCMRSMSASEYFAASRPVEASRARICAICPAFSPSASEIGDQRLAGALRRGIRGMRRVGSNRGPETVHAACVDDVRLIRRAQHGQEGARVQIDSTLPIAR
jgi:hypothetical protein